MSDHVSTHRQLPGYLVGPCTAALMSCAACAFIWQQFTDVDLMDTTSWECPCCGERTGTGPLYDLSGETTNRDWRSDEA